MNYFKLVSCQKKPNVEVSHDFAIRILYIVQHVCSIPR